MQHGLGHADGLELELAAEAERAVAEERHGHDRSLEDVDGVHVGHDAAPGLVVINHGAINEALRYDAVLHKAIDDQLVHPVRDLVHLAFGVQALLPGAALLELRAVRVALPEEVLVPQGRPVHRVLPVEPLVCLGNHLVDLCFDARALLLRENTRLLNAALHFARLRVPPLLVLTIIVIRLAVFALLAVAVLENCVPVRCHRLQLLPQIRKTGHFKEQSPKFCGILNVVYPEFTSGPHVITLVSVTEVT